MPNIARRLIVVSDLTISDKIIRNLDTLDFSDAEKTTILGRLSFLYKEPIQILVVGPVLEKVRPSTR